MLYKDNSDGICEVNKDVWSKVKRPYLVILIGLPWQQADLDRQPSSSSHLCSLTIFHHFLILLFSQYLFSSYWIPHFFPHLTFLFTSQSRTPPSFHPSFFLHSFFSPATRALCHPFFLIRLFVPSVPLPGVSSSVSLCVRSGSRLL